MISGDDVERDVEDLAGAALEQHRADLEPQWQAIASSYTEAMMAAQLMERAAAVVVVAAAIPQNQTDPKAIQDQFERAFTKVTLGQFKNESPVAGHEILAATINDAWSERNLLVHRFFLDNVISMFSVTACEKLVAELTDAYRQFESVSRQLMTLAEKTAEERGVDPDALLAFGKLAQVALADSPQLFETLNPWIQTDGEDLIAGVAQHFGMDIKPEQPATTASAAPEDTEDPEQT